MTLTLRLQRQLPEFRLDVDVICQEPVTAIYGPSGAGKTTLLNLVSGLARPDTGYVELDGDVLYCSSQGTDRPPEARRLGFVFQDDLLFPHLSVDANLRFGYERVQPAERRFEPGQIIDLLEIGPLLGRPSQQLSGGERQRVALGRALLSSPRMLLMDEPLASLDQGLKSRIIPYLRHVRSDLGIPILYVSHSVAEILELTRQVLVLQQGQVLAHGDFSVVSRDPRVLPLLDEFGFENVLPVEILNCKESACTARCGDQMLRIPFCDRPVGTRLFVGVRADDIILARQPPEGLSVRNRLQGMITEIAAVGATRLVTIDVGHPLVVKVTPEAVADLALAPGLAAWCLIKTHSLRLGPEID
ncbi:MAG TPA: molybdenum ABC transporter ATP-binding protein [Candidatus Latescibacteria bacterium]|nr:molybdenum ABC transporter ATP-binding protein [Candidatus Latescibacterota bacterium]